MRSTGDQGIAYWSIPRMTLVTLRPRSHSTDGLWLVHHNHVPLAVVPNVSGASLRRRERSAMGSELTVRSHWGSLIYSPGPGEWAAAIWAWSAGRASDANSGLASRGHGCATSPTIYASESTLPLRFMIWRGTFTSLFWPADSHGAHYYERTAEALLDAVINPRKRKG